MKSIVAALLLTLATPAFADAAQSFHDGKWTAVVSQGRQEGTAASLLLSGRAQLAIAAYDTRDKAKALELIGAAERDFDAALAKAPTNPEAQLQKAVAIGYRAKLTRSPGLGKDARKRFEAVRAAHPDMALGWAAVAGWHGGAIATLGGFLASTMMGAKAAEFEKGFAQALKLDPTTPVHRVFYAMTLLDLDAGNAGKAATALQGIGQLPAHDGYDALVRAQGVQLAAALKTGDAKAAQALARRLQAFGTLG
ncbi:MAG: hypothetical protein CFE37_01995 [Alphaproteobacteria bacterium PA4]|nr:MAG: hypothetical protein CFE37_01995 [Alphaproteobacteria bacterium PA4]